MNKFKIVVSFLLIFCVVSLWGQQPYGIGDNIDVPYVAPGTLTLDGNANEAAWQSAAVVDILAYWEGDWSGYPVPDIDATAKLLWTNDTLFAYVLIEDYQTLYFGPDTAAWWGEQIFIGIDRTLGGDTLVDDSWGGWPWYCPDQGPTVFKMFDQGITSNWGAWYDWGLDSTFYISPVDSGWADGTVFVDQVNYEWGVEMKIWAPQIRNNSMMGFNIGGATATPDTTFFNYPENAYAYFCWHPQPSDTLNGYPVDYLAGDIQRRSQSFGTITFVGGPEPYGIDDEIVVPYISPGTLTLDGNANEPAWQNAAIVDILAYWEGDWSGYPVPDIDATAKLLWTNDTLFAYVLIEDYQTLYFGPDTAAWWGEQIFIGVDGPMYGDPPGDMYSPGWEGGPWNLPAKGPTVYKMFDQGITSNWGSWYDWGLDSVFYISPVDSGWADGTVFVDQVNYMWGVEMKAYLPQAALHSRAGFNMGGATATPDTTFFNYPENAYAYFCWHPQPSDTLIGYPVDYLAGDIMRRAKSFGTIRFELTTTGIKPDYGDRDNLAKSFVLHQNYPNPFNPETQIKFTLDQGAHVKLDVYDILGRKVTTLVDGKRLAGGHSVTWSADDLASGIYFYRLSLDDKPVSTKKAILMR